MQQFPEHGTRILQHEDERESWSFALRKPIPALRALVHGYCTYEERRTGSPAHQHLPHPGIPLIVCIEGSLEVQGPIGEPSRIDPGQGFLAGLHTAPARTRSERSQRGVQIDPTPLGAHLLLGGMPMDSIANRSVSLKDLLGRAGREFCARLAEPRDDDATFDFVDAFLTKRMLDRRSTVPEGLVFAWEILDRSHGRLRIAEITTQLGWSRRRLVETFRRTVGLPPKAVARVLRFDHTLELWKANPTTPWSDVAFAGGYTDQAHFSREVRELSGQTPSELAAQLLPESGGMLAQTGTEHFDKTGPRS
jgi:AraC-like DNA-binding protein